jgi:hypothetical protein
LRKQKVDDATHDDFLMADFLMKLYNQLNEKLKPVLRNSVTPGRRGTAPIVRADLTTSGQPEVITEAKLKEHIIKICRSNNLNSHV